MSAEIATSPESMPASEVFLSEGELRSAAQQAVDNGLVTVELSQGNTVGEEVFPTIKFRKDQLIDSDSESAPFSGKFEDFEFKKPDEMLDMAKTEASSELIEKVARDNGWYLLEPDLKREIEDGRVSQHYRLSFNGGHVELVNFSNTKLTDTNLDQIKNVLTRVSNVSGAGTLNVTNAICIQSADRFSNDAVGAARGLSGVIRLHEGLLDPENEIGYEKFKDIGTSPLESTLTHEFAHLVELNDTEMRAYGKETGWSTEYGTVVDDYGNAVYVDRHTLDVSPHNLQVSDKDGKTREVHAKDHYGDEVIANAKPVTRYGYTNEREDLAEAFVPYVYAKDTLDPVRKNALDGVLHRGSGGEHGPFRVDIEEVPLSERIGNNITPHHYIVAEPYFREEVTPYTPNQMVAYGGETKTIVDDYGNQMTVHGGHHPRSI